MRYFRLLINNWISLIGNFLTVVSLILGFIGPSSLPGFFSTIPREYYFLIAFISFAYVNYRINSQFTSDDFHFDFESQDGVQVVRGGFELDGLDIDISDVLILRLTGTLFVNNRGEKRSVHFVIGGINPAVTSMDSLSKINVDLRRKDTGKGLQNPHYFEADEMVKDLQFTLDIPIIRKLAEEEVGSLYSLRSIIMQIHAVDAAGNITKRDLDFDLLDLHVTLESSITSKMQHTQTSELPAYGFISALKEYYGVKRYPY